MCPFRRVEADRAGPSAVGVLLPPGERRFLILRPRSLAYDLVLLRPDEPAFHDLSLVDGHAAVRQLMYSLEDQADRHIDTPASPGSSGFRLRLTIGPFTLLACPREPGRPYRPLTLADETSAAAAAGELTHLLAPHEAVVLELYTNTIHFGPIA